MLKITMLILSGLIIYFFLRTRKGMLKIDDIYNKENSAEMKQKQLEQQKRLIKNKTFKWKPNEILMFLVADYNKALS
mgnify:FL=1